MKKLLLALGILALIGFLFNNIDTPNTPAAPQAQAEAQTATESAEVVTPEPEPQEEVIEVTADELLAAYKENELAGDQKYKGKTLLVTGVLDSIQSGMGDTPYLLLKAGDEFEFSMPQAHFDKSETDSLVALKKGESIQIQCVSDGEMMGSPMLKGCKVV